MTDACGNLGLGTGARRQTVEEPAQTVCFLGDDVGAHGQCHDRDVFFRKQRQGSRQALGAQKTDDNVDPGLDHRGGCIGAGFLGTAVITFDNVLEHIRMVGVPGREGFAHMIAERLELAGLRDHQADMQRLGGRRRGGQKQGQEKRHKKRRGAMSHAAYLARRPGLIKAKSEFLRRRGGGAAEKVADDGFQNRCRTLCMDGK